MKQLKSNKSKTPTAATIGASRTTLTNQQGNNAMNILAPTTQAVTMSSRDIAELTGKNHADICRDIRAMLAGLHGGKGTDYIRKANLLYITNQGVECVQYDKNNPNAWEYLLDRRHTEILVTGYDVVRRAAVIDRLIILEQERRNTPSRLPNVKELALMVIQAEEDKERLLLENKGLEDQVAEMTPDVKAFERIAKSNGSMCITDAAKHLQIKPKALFDKLHSMKWIYRRTGNKNWLGYQDKLQQGVLEHKVRSFTDSEGEEQTREQVLVTAKGIAKLAKILEVEEVA
ncbi:phage regulatory protein/antirepressor Ant [Xenorhabdus sp. PB61.4]|uniref:phage antirepressor KilAC domain-containing protein n=1 Tax=Xenorhabdus sp. PB61.4 TaxID=2788940 RepID=UPI001E627F39|nr:phage regulatory protein/antirepressor Ant [Xenorhabdus sp. PB61.4]MCC8364907.1 phage regulatory protein/antirepressor Ant [Xenorhabdus sp. PB61.4]